MTKKRLLLIGAGAAGAVVAKKIDQNQEMFGYLHIASRTLDKCVKIQKELAIESSISQLDADDTDAVISCIKDVKPFLVMNLALPYQDLSIMEACLACGVHYLDTANYEPKDEAKYAYHWQWAYQERFKKAGLMALLGCGFDPGVTNAFCAYAKHYLFDGIETIDIIDCNDGNHHKAFATNFNPEINIREITQEGKYYKDGAWHSTNPLELSKMIDFPEVGPKKAYLINHEEMESLVKHMPEIKQIRFWMTFSEDYITHLRVCENLGLTRIDEIDYEGQKIIPLQFLKALLPEPASLAEHYEGKTSIGCMITGTKDGAYKQITLYNVCQHQEAFRDVGAQAVSYTTGVPAVTGAIMMAKGLWNKAGVLNIEELDSKPFLDELAKQGLPWHIKEEVLV